MSAHQQLDQDSLGLIAQLRHDPYGAEVVRRLRRSIAAARSTAQAAVWRARKAELKAERYQRVLEAIAGGTVQSQGLAQMILDVEAKATPEAAPVTRQKIIRQKISDLVDWLAE